MGERDDASNSAGAVCLLSCVRVVLAVGSPLRVRGMMRRILLVLCVFLCQSRFRCRKPLVGEKDDASTSLVLCRV